jgi:L-fuconolactonase
MRITDAQIHIWLKRPAGLLAPLGLPVPPSQSASDHARDSFAADQVIVAMDTAGVDRAILMPRSFDGDDNGFCLAAARANPHRFAVMGRLALEDPSRAGLISLWRDTPGMLGLRLTFTRGRSSGWLADGTADWLWPLAEAAGIPVMIHAPGQAGQIRRIATRHPALRLTVDHAGLSGDSDRDQIDALIGMVADLSDLPNVAVKASSLPSVVSDDYPFPSLYPRIKRLFDAFGPRRMFWGSDLTRLPCTYRQAVTHFTEELGFLSDTDLEWIMGRGVETWLGWDTGGSALAGQQACS